MTCDAFMEYFVSVREKNVSYTELWREKNRILEEAIRTIKNIDHPSLFERNKIFHQY